MKRLALAALALLAAAALTGVLRPEGASAVEAQAGERTVTVTGTGSVRATPDRAGFSFGVETQADTARAALAANAAEARRLLDALRRAGAGDLQTEGVTVSPRVSEGGRIAGFSAVNTVSASIAAGRAGALIDAAVAAGANQVYGPSFTAGDAEALYRRALAAAVAQARERAGVLAEAAGAAVGPVQSVVEGGGGPIATESKAVASDAGTPIEPGSRETTATVTVTFALR